MWFVSIMEVKYMCKGRNKKRVGVVVERIERI
jgi:hypothetical protein